MLQQPNVGKQKNLAFTLVEILTVVVISAILIVAAIPGYETFMRNSASLNMASRLETSLRLAQGQAIKLGVPVTVCPISSSFNPTSSDFDPTSTTDNWPCQGTTAWDAWKVFSDPDFNATEDFSNGWPLIEYVSDIQPGSITSNISGPITFDPMGFANLDPSVTRSGWSWSDGLSSGEWQWSTSYGSSYGGSYYRAFTITPPGCTGNNARVVTVTQNGVIEVSLTSC
jgi:Tfp pilus assembly protein FimT